MSQQNHRNSDLNGTDSGDRFNLKCSHCSKNLSSKQNLREHLYIHTGERPYKCKYPGCLKAFRQGSLLSTHFKTHKIEEINRKRLPISYFKVTSASTELKPLMVAEAAKIVTELGRDFGFAKPFLAKLLSK